MQDKILEFFKKENPSFKESLKYFRKSYRGLVTKENSETFYYGICVLYKYGSITPRHLENRFRTDRLKILTKLHERKVHLFGQDFLEKGEGSENKKRKLNIGKLAINPTTNKISYNVKLLKDIIKILKKKSEEKCGGEIEIKEINFDPIRGKKFYNKILNFAKDVKNKIITNELNYLEEVYKKENLKMLEEIENEFIEFKILMTKFHSILSDFEWELERSFKIHDKIYAKRICNLLLFRAILQILKSLVFTKNIKNF
uniref:Uncharacterized protein n=1 Tax=Meloidogyne enterolobii TaxID=390850 RepID=A0A6V7V4L7_MELEN|nr:unnamed protein product [Meloidogyne enterolobii]